MTSAVINGIHWVKSGKRHQDFSSKNLFSTLDNLPSIRLVPSWLLNTTDWQSFNLMMIFVAGLVTRAWCRTPDISTPLTAQRCEHGSRCPFKDNISSNKDLIKAKNKFNRQKDHRKQKDDRVSLSIICILKLLVSTKCFWFAKLFLDLKWKAFVCWKHVICAMQESMDLK